MTIEILNITIIQDIDDGNDISRAVTIRISDGQKDFLWAKGGLPLTGDLQPILDVIETELFQAASAKGIPFDVFEVVEKRVLKAFVLVIMDEINILRQQHGLPDRIESQIRTAIKNKLKVL